MKRTEETRTQKAPLFTVDDHLRVQHQIEVRANELWRAGGCREDSALSDWLRAERDALLEFVLAYDPRSLVRRKPSRRPTVEIKPPRPRALS
jgi:hypothetical protein